MIKHPSLLSSVLLTFKSLNFSISPMPHHSIRPWPSVIFMLYRVFGIASKQAGTRTTSRVTLSLGWRHVKPFSVFTALGSSNNSNLAPWKSMASASGESEWRRYRPVREESLDIGLQSSLKVSGGNLLGSGDSAPEGLDNPSEPW